MSDPAQTTRDDLEKYKFVSTGVDKDDIAVKVANADGSVITPVQLFTLPFDAITATYPSATQEVYESRVGGIAGAIQQTITINYTDATKAYILNVARS